MSMIIESFQKSTLLEEIQIDKCKTLKSNVIISLGELAIAHGKRSHSANAN